MRKGKLIAIIVMALILLFPLKLRYKDGGTLKYQAILYSVTKWHAISNSGPEFYYVGTEVKIFGLTIFNNSKDQPRDT